MIVHYIYIYLSIYMYIYTIIIYMQDYFTGIQVFYKDFARENIPRHIFIIMEKLISRNTSHQVLQRLQLLALYQFVTM